MPPNHPEISHSDRDVELIIFNRAIIHTDATILIVQSGIIIFQIVFIVVFFILIIFGFVVVDVDSRVQLGVVDCHKLVVVFTQDLVFYTPYCIKIYCLSSIFFLFFWSGHRGSKTYSSWGGVVPSPSIGYDYL